MLTANRLLRPTAAAIRNSNASSHTGARLSTTRPIAAMDAITLPAPFDAHVHLRQGNMMRLVTPHVEKGGIRMAFVMASLFPFPLPALGTL